MTSPQQSFTYHGWHEIHYGALHMDIHRIRQDKEHIHSLVKATQPEIDLISTGQNQGSRLKKYFGGPNTANKNIAADSLDNSYGNNALMLLKLNKNKIETEEYKKCLDLLRNYGANEDQMNSKLENYSGAHAKLPFFSHKNDASLLSAIKNYIQDEKKIEDIYDGETEEDSSISLIQWCCKQGFETCIDFMIEQKVNMNRMLPRNTKHPLLYLVKNCDLFEKYLNKDIFKPEDIPEEILVNVIKQIKNRTDLANTVLEFLNEPELKDKRETILQAKDHKGRTALHYAAMYTTDGLFLKLLDLECSLMIKDNIGKTPLDLLNDPKLLKIHLDNCVQLKNEEENHCSSFEISINFKTFMAKENIYNQKENVNEEKGTTETVNESLFLKTLLHKKFHNCLNHPVVGTYIFIKWRKLQKLFWFYFVLNLSACVCSYAGTVMFNPKHDSVYEALMLFVSSLIILVIINFIELAIYGRQFWRNFQYGVTCCLILSLVSNILYIVFDKTSYNVLVTLSCTTFLTTYKMFLILQIHPIFAVNVMLLRTTTFNFFKVMCFYSLPVLAFALCFHLLNEDESKSFASTMFQTIVAFTGNISVNDTDKFKSNPVFGSIVVVLFIFIVIIILNNLLSALAISDLNQIYQEASSIEKEEITLYILMFEDIFLNSNFFVKLLCYPVSPKLFANPNNFHISIFPNINSNVQIGDNKRQNLGINRAIVELTDFVHNEKSLQNTGKTISIESVLMEKVAEMEKKLDALLNAVSRK